MKTYDVLMTEQAEKDLDGIFEYIAFTLGCCWRQEIPTMPLNHQSKKRLSSSPLKG